MPFEALVCCTERMVVAMSMMSMSRMAMSMMAVEAEVVETGNGTWAHTSVQIDDPSSDLLLPV